MMKFYYFILCKNLMIWFKKYFKYTCVLVSHKIRNLFISCSDRINRVVFQLLAMIKVT